MPDRTVRLVIYVMDIPFSPEWIEPSVEVKGVVEGDVGL